MTTLFIVGFSTFFVSLLCVWLVGVVAYRQGWVVEPRAERWHQGVIALYGGVGIFAAFFFGVATFFFLEPIPFNRSLFHEPMMQLLLGSGFMFLVGLIDDRLHIKPSTKLIGEIIAVTIPITLGFTIDLTAWHLLNVMVTFFWFLGIINAVNLIDNMDGLASGVIIITLLTLVVIRTLGMGFQENDFLLFVSFILLFAVAGFWMFNRSPASIFMGDAGSLFLGYMVAGIAVATTSVHTSSTIFAILLPAVALALPLFDTMLVSLVRMWHGRSVSLGGTDHSSHRLVGLGFSENTAVRILYCLAAIGGLVAISLQVFPTYTPIFVVLYVGLLIFIGVYLGRVKVYSAPQMRSDNSRWTPLFTEFLHKRHAAEVVLDFFLISVSYYLAYFLRFEGTLSEQAPRYIESLPLVISACLIGVYLAGVYRGIWHFVTVADLGKFIKGVLFGLSGSVFLVVVVYQFNGYSRSIFAIFAVLLFLLLVGTRLSFRILDDVIRRKTIKRRKENVLIYGAGQAGKLLYEESIRNPAFLSYRVIGFIDDDKEKHHFSIAGVDIYSSEEVCRGQNLFHVPIHQIWISSTRISEDKVVNIAHHLEEQTSQTVNMRRLSLMVEEFGGNKF